MSTKQEELKAKLLPSHLYSAAKRRFFDLPLDEYAYFELSTVSVGRTHCEYFGVEVSFRGTPQINR